uniref:C2H2-type domain-containing protein n=1 Tax=Magallana gigas TaxID=29159 RepID=A0A8W8MKS2_MAGGI
MRGWVTFAENPSVSAAHVLPYVQSGNRGEGSGAWHVLVGIAGKVEITVGGYRFVHPIYVGPLQDKMLFGIDFLKSHGAQISCETGALRVKGVPGMIEMSSGVDKLVLIAVSSRRVRIPSHTAQVIEYDLANEMSDFIIEPANVFPLGIVASRTYNNSGNKGKLCVINMTDRGHFVKTGSVVGIVTAACAVKNSEASVLGCQQKGKRIVSILHEITASDLGDHPDDDVSAGGSSNTDSASTKDLEERLRKQPDGPFRGTRSHSKDSAMEEQFQLYVFDEENGMFEEESASGLQEPLGQEASMTVFDLSQSSGSDQEVNMRPCQERTHTKERGVKKCAVHSCRETFSGATPMLYHIRRDHGVATEGCRQGQLQLSSHPRLHNPFRSVGRVYPGTHLPALLCRGPSADQTLGRYRKAGVLWSERKCP